MDERIQKYEEKMKKTLTNLESWQQFVQEGQIPIFSIN